MACPRCGTTCVRSARYCAHCGLRLPTTDAPAADAAETPPSLRDGSTGGGLDAPLPGRSQLHGPYRMEPQQMQANEPTVRVQPAPTTPRGWSTGPVNGAMAGVPTRAVSGTGRPRQMMVPLVIGAALAIVGGGGVGLVLASHLLGAPAQRRSAVVVQPTPPLSHALLPSQVTAQPTPTPVPTIQVATATAVPAATSTSPTSAEAANTPTPSSPQNSMAAAPRPTQLSAVQPAQHSTLLYVAAAGYGYTGVNVRARPRLGALVVTSVPNGEQITILGPPFQNGNGETWYRVSVGNTTGYVRTKLLSRTEPMPMPALYVDTADQGFAGLNLRTRPNKQSAIKLVIPNGVHIPALLGTTTDSQGHTWYRVRFLEQTGYVYGSLLSHVGPAPTDKLAAQLGQGTDRLVPIVVDDTDFSGGFSNDDGLYKWHTAKWLYSQKTRYARMHATFYVDGTPVGNDAGDAGLGLVGLDSEDSAKTPIRIEVNGHTVYQGPDPLPNDFFPYNPEQGNWGDATLTFLVSYLKRGANDPAITDLAAEGSVRHPPYFLLDYAVVVAYRA
jgi:uncharacterized protein YgiM (DUF1202 family)